jgi:hypothetical protein
MREKGLPQVLTWRWTPCVAFVLGSISFAAFMLLAIPDRIGQVPTEPTSNSLGFQLARTQAAPAPQGDWSSDTSTNTASATPRLADRTAHRAGDASGFPKRGFTPPLERRDPPPAPPPVAAPLPPPPQPQLNIPPIATPPLPPQPQLNVPLSALPPAEQPPGSAASQPEALPQASAEPPAPDAQSARAPQAD